MQRTRWMGIIRILSMALPLGNIMLGAAGCGNRPQTVQAQGPKPASVETTHPQKRDVSRPITLPADIPALETLVAGSGGQCIAHLWRTNEDALG